MTFRMTARGVETTLRLAETENRRSLRAASQSINDSARRGRTRAARRILSQVALPQSYLSPGGGRLVVGRFASPQALEASIRARSRPTSLARFARNPRIGKGNVTISVKRGRVTFLRRAFLVRLRRGTALTDTQHNLGLAIRLRPGERIANKRIQAAALGRGLYLLYGPSVQQVFLDEQDTGVAVEIAPKIADDLSRSYLRRLGNI